MWHEITENYETNEKQSLLSSKNEYLNLYYNSLWKEVGNDTMYDVLIIFHWSERKTEQATENYKWKNNKTINL